MKFCFLKGFYSNLCMSVIFSLLCVRNKSTNWRRTMRRPLTYCSDSWMHRRWITSDCRGRSSTCRDPQRQSLRIFHHLTSFSQFHHIRLRRDKKEKYVLFFLIHCPFFFSFFIHIEKYWVLVVYLPYVSLLQGVDRGDLTYISQDSFFYFKFIIIYLAVPKSLE